MIRLTEIFISLKPKFAKLIGEGEKDHEFRDYRPQRTARRFWVYVSSPVSRLKYTMEMGAPVKPGKYPEMESGTGSSIEDSKPDTPFQSVASRKSPILYHCLS